MKNIESHIGGRYRYNSDFKFMQEMALAMTEFLKCANDNFVISGCENGQGGYVWLNGKIRVVDDATQDNINYIVCMDSEGPEIQYGDDTSHKLYTDYAAKYSDKKESICIEKIDGKFPTIRDKFWEHFGLAKNSGKQQNVKPIVNFENGAKMNKIKLKNGIVSINDNQLCFDTNDGNGFSLYFNEPTIGIRKNKQTVASIGSYQKSTSIFGKVSMPSLKGHDIRILGKSNASNYIIDGVEINNVLKRPVNIKKTEWLPFQTSDGVNYPLLQARQIKDKIFIKGRIDKQYIVNNYNDDDFNSIITYNDLTSNNRYAEEVFSCNAKSIDDDNVISEYGKVVKMKLKLKLPADISLPTDGTLPGCLIMSLYPENYLHNVQESDYYSLGNAQLQLGSDGFLYVIIGTGYKMYFGSQRPYINFNYIV